MARVDVLTLNNGVKMPILGYGTYRALDVEIERALNLCLLAGYRHIDCAPIYLNEKVIGKVLKEWIDGGRIERKDLFITTKLPDYGNRPEDVEKYLMKSLSDLNLTYIDLYLIHVPFGFLETSHGESNGELVLDMATDHIGVWKKFEEYTRAGLIRSIGISNFNKSQVQRILDNASIKPASLQIEMHVYLQQNELVDFCKSNNIVVTAYSPLGAKGIANLYKQSDKEIDIPELYDIPEIKAIAARLNKTPAQILLKWIISRDVAAIPMSTSETHLQENLSIFDFDLTADDMENIKRLNKDIRICTLKKFKGVETHPEFPFK